MELEYLSCIETNNNKTTEGNDEVCIAARGWEQGDGKVGGANDEDKDKEEEKGGCVQQLVRKRKHCQQLSLCCNHSYR